MQEVLITHVYYVIYRGLFPSFCCAWIMITSKRKRGYNKDDSRHV